MTSEILPSDYHSTCLGRRYIIRRRTERFHDEWLTDLHKRSPILPRTARFRITIFVSNIDKVLTIFDIRELRKIFRRGTLETEMV